MQTQTRRLQRVGILATRQEAEFVSGVLEAADLSHAIVEVDQGLELRVDPDDADRVQELIERLDVHRQVGESARQSRGEANGRRLVLAATGIVCLGVAGLVVTGVVGSFGPVWGTLAAVVLGLVGTGGLLLAVLRRPA